MPPFIIRDLQSADAQALLAFETRNRAWFECHIDPRPPAFYSVQGVADHIDEYLSGFAARTWHPFIIQAAGGEIVGRANLKNINSPKGFAEAGYRIDQRSCGRGLATLALRQLVSTARDYWKLAQLFAIVEGDNVGSRTVLERCGFAAEHSPEQGQQRFVRSL